MKQKLERLVWIVLILGVVATLATAAYFRIVGRPSADPVEQVAQMDFSGDLITSAGGSFDILSHEGEARYSFTLQEEGWLLEYNGQYTFYSILQEALEALPEGEVVHGHVFVGLSWEQYQQEAEGLLTEIAGEQSPVIRMGPWATVVAEYQNGDWTIGRQIYLREWFNLDEEGKYFLLSLGNDGQFILETRDERPTQVTVQDPQEIEFWITPIWRGAQEMQEEFLKLLSE